MSERGFVAIDRGVWDHPLFEREMFSHREAWFWLISHAVWEPKRVRVGRGSFDLQRGQCVFAIRFLAEKWMWSEPKVRRYLKRLADDAAALLQATREATIITICNYDDYQSMRRTDVREVDDTVNDERSEGRRKEEPITNNQQPEEKKETRASALVVVDGWPADYREQFWARYPHKVGKPRALAKLDGVRKRGVGFDDIMTGLDRYIASKPPDRPWLNPETFINQERWADQPAHVTTSQGPNHGKRTVHDAARSLSQSVLALDEPAPGLCDAAGGGPVRLLPPR